MISNHGHDRPVMDHPGHAVGVNAEDTEPRRLHPGAQRTGGAIDPKRRPAGHGASMGGRSAHARGAPLDAAGFPTASEVDLGTGLRLL